MNPGPEERSVRERGAARILDRSDLTHSETAYEFEGYRNGGTDVSFIVIDAPPGIGPKLHRHPYEEVFVVQEGSVTFTVGEGHYRGDRWAGRVPDRGRTMTSKGDTVRQVVRDITVSPDGLVTAPRPEIRPL